MNINLSERQYEAFSNFFSGEYDEILYGGGARGGKSYIIGTLLAIGVASMPGSQWLVSRTVLSDLHATTLATFYQVLKELGFSAKSYKDKIKDKKYIEFKNGCRVFVIQVNNEPSDPEFDRLGSHSFTGAFLDEAQQMVTKVRSILAGRFSETTGDFKFNVPKDASDPTKIPDESQLGYRIGVNIIGDADLKKSNLTGEYLSVVKKGKFWVGIIRKEELFIPYTVIDRIDAGNAWQYHCAWRFTPCTLLSCNPGKNFTYTDFWKPFSKGILPKNRKFIRALVGDNPFVEKEYVKRLERSDDEVSKQRLLYGNFEYDDDPTLLFSSDKVYAMFEGNVNSGMKYMTVDAARLGKDNTVIFIWEGFTVIGIEEIKRAKLTSQKEKILELKSKHGIDLDNIIVDEVGVGGGLVDMLGCKGFVANATAIHPMSSKLLQYKRRNYANLRTQCFYYLKKYIDEENMKIKLNDTRIKETITEELLFIRQSSVDDDKKIMLQPKKELKALLGRSPDYADALSFRMYWVVKQIQELGYEVVEEEEEKVGDTPIHQIISEWEEEQQKKSEDPLDFDIY